MAATTDSAGQQNIRFSGHTLDKATKAKVHLENYYSNLITQHIERRNRFKNISQINFCDYFRQTFKIKIYFQSRTTTFTIFCQYFMLNNVFLF